MDTLTNSKKFIFLLLLTVTFLLSACAHYAPTQDGPPKFDVDVSQIPNAVPKPEQKSKKGNPPSYVALGKRYYVRNTAKGYDKTGIASWYGTKFNNQMCSDGEMYNMFKMTAANKTLPLPCYAKVANLENGRQIIVKINDRGPFAPNRIIDLSYAAAKKLGITVKGTGLVRVTTIDPTQSFTTDTTENMQLATDEIPQIYLQVGAYANEHSAKMLLAEVENIVDSPTNIYPSRANGHKLYRVQIGPIADVDHSDIITTILETNHLPEPVTVIKEALKQQTA